MSESPDTHDQAFRFSLWHAFFLLTIICIHCALVKAFGLFLGLMFFAAIIHGSILQVARPSSLFWGAASGVVLAIVMTVFCAFLCDRLESEMFFVMVFLAPVAGFFVGMHTSASELNRLGI